MRVGAGMVMLSFGLHVLSMLCPCRICSEHHGGDAQGPQMGLHSCQGGRCWVPGGMVQGSYGPSPEAEGLAEGPGEGTDSLCSHHLPDRMLLLLSEGTPGQKAKLLLLTHHAHLLAHYAYLLTCSLTYQLSSCLPAAAAVSNCVKTAFDC